MPFFAGSQTALAILRTATATRRRSPSAATRAQRCWAARCSLQSQTLSMATVRQTDRQRRGFSTAVQIRTIILPRQARDKQEEHPTTEAAVPTSRLRSVVGDRRRCETRTHLLCRLFALQMRSFYQDRLGKNTGKPSKGDDLAFLAQVERL